MLAAHRDQENLVHSHQVPTKNGGSKNLGPKTPGARYPKTPLKVPLNDENGPHITGGKALMGTSKNTMGKKQVMATTPAAGTRRAPLGNKTTNAKARAVAPGGTVKGRVQEIEKSQVKQPSHQKPKPKPVNTAPVKFEVRSDEHESGDLDIEYAPPKPEDLPYESDVFPDGILTFEGLKPENIMKGYYERYHDPVDENGVRIKDKKFEEALQKALKEGDERILKDIENTDWSVSDVPETKIMARPQKKQDELASKPEQARLGRTTKQYPPTINSRRAASALSMASTTKEGKPRPTAGPVSHVKRSASFLLPGRKISRPIEPTKSIPESAIGEAVSRSTLGYSKGRSASSAIKTTGRTLSRSASGASVSSDRSDVTITPANFLKTQETKANKADEWLRPQFLSIFDVNEESDEDSHVTNIDNIVDEFEDFQLKLDDD